MWLSVNDTPGQCSVQSTNMPHAIPIQRQDPSTGGRLLGVRMAPDGSVTNEFQYRLQQLREMAMKLAAAPIRHRWCINGISGKIQTGDTLLLTDYNIFCQAVRRNPMPILQSNASKTRDQSEHETWCNIWTTWAWRIELYGPQGRTEHYGAFGIALLAQMLCIRHSTNSNRWISKLLHRQRHGNQATQIRRQAGNGIHQTQQDRLWHMGWNNTHPELLTMH